jgi:tRNA(Ile2) C34 agmatinyltransferase TiaS
MDRMRDGDDEGTEDVLPAAAVEAAGERDLDTPNCPDCLTRMEAEESTGGDPYWSCTECGLVALA